MWIHPAFEVKCGSAEGAPSLKRPNRFVRLFAVLAVLSGMLIFAAPAAVASPSPGGAEALWDGVTIPPLFGAIESDVADQAILCFQSDYYGNALTVDGGTVL